jgi:hypothetical protein
MTALKGFLTGFLSFLLLLSLTIFGIALMVNSTVLSPDFIASQVDKADIKQIANEFVDEHYIDEIPEDLRFFEDVVYEVIEDHEPWLKEQFRSATNAIYDYLLDKTDDLEINIPLEDLKESVRESLWRNFMAMLPEWISSPDDEGLKKLIYENIHDFVGGIPASYLPEEYASLSGQQLRQYVDSYFQDIESQIIDGRLPAPLEAEIEDLLLPYFNQYYNEFVEDIPSEYVINENEISTEAMEALETAKHWIGVFKTVFYALISLIILLIAGIILIHRNVKASTRSLSITFLIYGAVEFALVLAARFVVPNYLPTDDIPISLQNFITDVYVSVLAPLQWFSLGILITGVALLLVSIFYKRGEAVTKDDEE